MTWFSDSQTVVGILSVAASGLSGIAAWKAATATETLKKIEQKRDEPKITLWFKEYKQTVGQMIIANEGKSSFLVKNFTVALPNGIHAKVWNRYKKLIPDSQFGGFRAEGDSDSVIEPMSVYKLFFEDPNKSEGSQFELRISKYDNTVATIAVDPARLGPYPVDSSVFK